MFQESANFPLAVADDAADRRAFPRIPSGKLPIKRVRIPNRPTAALVDLSSGGALLNLPCQLRPESRFALHLETPREQVSVPFQLIRCYVSTLHGGISYHAAGAFENLLDLDALAQRSSTAVSRLLDTLERLRRGVQKTAGQSRSDAAFDEILGAAIGWLQEDESVDLVALKVKARLTQAYPSLMIVPCLLPSRDEFNSVACFGLTLRSRHALSAHDRRLLKANAQLISMLEDTRREMSEEAEPFPASPVVHSAGEWMQAQASPRPAYRAVARSPIIAAGAMRSGDTLRNGGERMRSAHESGLQAVIESAMLQPAAS